LDEEFFIRSILSQAGVGSNDIGPGCEVSLGALESVRVPKDGQQSFFGFIRITIQSYSANPDEGCGPVKAALPESILWGF